MQLCSLEPSYIVNDTCRVRSAMKPQASGRRMRGGGAWCYYATDSGYIKKPKRLMVQNAETFTYDKNCSISLEFAQDT